MSEENVVVVESTANKDAAVLAAFDRVVNPGKQQDEPKAVEPEPQEPATVEETASVEPETSPALTNDQIQEIMAGLSKIPKLEKQLNDTGGRYGAIKQSLEQLQQRMTTTQTGDPAAVEDMLQGIKDEFGDDNPLYLSLKSAFSKVVAGKSIDPGTVKTIASEVIAESKRAEFEEAKTLLTEQHPTWKQDINSPEFKAWTDSLPEKERNRIVWSNDPYFVSDKLDTFQAWKEKSKTPAPMIEVKKPEAKPSARLLKAVMPTNGSKPKAQVEDDKDAQVRAAFERAAGIRKR